MSLIESQTVTINKSDKEIFNIISDFTKFSYIIPQQAQNLKVTKDSCSFSIQGMRSLFMWSNPFASSPSRACHQRSTARHDGQRIANANVRWRARTRPELSTPKTINKHKPPFAPSTKSTSRTHWSLAVSTLPTTCERTPGTQHGGPQPRTCARDAHPK